MSARQIAELIAGLQMAKQQGTYTNLQRVTAALVYHVHARQFVAEPILKDDLQTVDEKRQLPRQADFYEFEKNAKKLGCDAAERAKPPQQHQQGQQPWHKPHKLQAPQAAAHAEKRVRLEDANPGSSKQPKTYESGSKYGGKKPEQ